MKEIRLVVARHHQTMVGVIKIRGAAVVKDSLVVGTLITFLSDSCVAGLGMLLLNATIDLIKLFRVQIGPTINQQISIITSMELLKMLEIQSGCLIVEKILEIQSGAPNHVTPDPTNTMHQNNYNEGDKLLMGNGCGLQIKSTGFSNLHVTNGALPLKNILHVLEITKNLISISKLTVYNNVIVEFHPFSVFVMDKATRKVLLQGMVEDGLYRVWASRRAPPSYLSYRSNTPEFFSCFSASLNNSELWHFRLGHLLSLSTNEVA